MFREHLKQRGWTPILHSWVDWTSEIVTFPLYSTSGKMIGYQRYDWKAEKTRDNGKPRYFTYISEAYKGCYVYGLENIFGHGALFVTEGIFDSIRVSLNWFDCLATLTATPTKQTIQWLKMFAVNRPLIAIADEDGKLGRGWADKQYVPPAHDISDMEHDAAGRWLDTMTGARLLGGVG